MSRRTKTITTDYFDDLYAKKPDPWGFSSSAYERDKYADTLTMLEREHYGLALEVGCSIGIFTGLLAPRCDELVATEPSATARAQAQRAVAGLGNVTVHGGSLPADLPPGRFQLIVLSEVIYYLDRADATAAARRCCDSLKPHGEIVLCHWLGETDYPLTGDEAADLALEEAATRGWRTRTRREAKYRLDHIRAPAR